MSQKQLSILVFISGLSVMAVEMTGLRLLAPYFGTSLIVTTVLIGSMMGFLSLGYSLGGKYGDRNPTLKALCKITMAASGCILLIPLIGRPILKMAASTLQPLLMGGTLEQPEVAFASIVSGMIGTLVLFAVPVTLMGMVSPWAIRLSVSEVESSGKAAGKLYALSTFGSILGSFLPAIVLIPNLGVKYTFFFIGFILMLPSAWGYFSNKIVSTSLPVALFGLSFLLPSFAIRPADGVIHESESLYHFIQVAEEPYGKCENARHLYLNEGIAVHSVKCPDDTIELAGYWAMMTTSPMFIDNLENFDSALVIGLAGGTMAKGMLDIYPDVKVDGVEIDGDVIEIGKKYFDNAHPNINPIVMDGRIFLQMTKKKYDIIQIDAYRQPYIPFHLVTQEFFQEVHDHLEDDGVLAINVASVRGISTDLTAMIYRTIREVFPWVITIKATRSNEIIIASKKPELNDVDFSSLENPAKSPRIKNALKRLKKRDDYKNNRYLQSYLSRTKLDVPNWKEATLLSDDYAPVEMAWDLMTLEFVK